MGALQKDSGGDQDRVLPASLSTLVLLSRYSDVMVICISGVRLASVRQRTLVTANGSSAEIRGRGVRQRMPRAMYAGAQ